MSLKHHNAKADGTAPALTPSQLAHELNNLLDGSLRQVGMVMRELKDLAETGELHTDDATQDGLTQRLRTADRSMHQMADVIERYANTPLPAEMPPAQGAFADADCVPTPAVTSDLVRSRGSLREVFDHAVNVYGPASEEAGITLNARLDPAVALLPAGPIYTVLANAINNAIQAIQRSDLADAPQRIDIDIVPTDRDVVVKVVDTGVGLDPVLFDTRGGFRFGVTTRRNGHGIGLDLCRRIAKDLGGQLHLSTNPAGRGTQVTLQYPFPKAQASAEETREARLAG
ncbi:MAG: ATP-binding protein [Planctomycetota bacterium]